MIQGLDLPASLELYVQKEKFVIFLLLKLIIYDKKLFRSRGRTVVGYRGLKLGKMTALWGKKKKLCSTLSSSLLCHF